MGLSKLQECIESLKSYVDALYERKRQREEMRVFVERQMGRFTQVPTEHQVCVALMDWFEWEKPPGWEFVFHIPNGGHRHIAVAKKLQAEGVKTGVPDYCYPVPTRIHHCLWMEAKKEGVGRLSQAQIEFRDFLVSMGHAYVVFDTWELGAEAVRDYLREKLKESYLKKDRMKGAA